MLWVPLLGPPFYVLKVLARCQGSGDISFFAYSLHCFKAWKHALFSLPPP